MMGLLFCGGRYAEGGSGRNVSLCVSDETVIIIAEKSTKKKGAGIFFGAETTGGRSRRRWIQRL
jgi:hypothetical protein